MVSITVKPTNKLQGTLVAPASKSYTQRMLIAAALSEGSGRVVNPLLSEDTQATFRAITALGAKVQKNEDNWIVQGASELNAASNLIDVGESGATLRFMIPIAALIEGHSAFLLSSSLERRPIEPLLSSLKMLNIKAYPKQIGNQQAIVVEGEGMAGGKTNIPGNVSSQFISGLMFACPMAKADTEIQVTTPLESKDYIRMTKEVLAMHHIDVQISDDYRHIYIPGRQTFKQVDCKVPGDFSSAAFLLAASAITNSNVKIDNLYRETVQGDKAILDVLKQMGINIGCNDVGIEVQGTGDLLKAVDIDVKDIPDLVPICAVLACYAEGQSRIFNAQRLRFKESDRLATIHQELTNMGALISMDESSLTIKGSRKLYGATINPHNDHRIAMSCTVAALRAEGETTIENAECIRKSYPSFYTDLITIGAEIVGGKLVR
ncbi:MAG: 3-phosphoshikimate 1-carboxyvinyltransferase [Nitrososphaerota archaeon]|jgi:3-phosphoshikimate 1-carboxyvinyltransferase|nr:3-phosphoshikimate 1-carboxyvinyltransferase [Nitrososphaerota archaeon]